MSTDPIIRFRAHPLTKRLLNRLRDEKAVNPSAWLRIVVQEALEREFPDFADSEAAEASAADPQLPHEDRGPRPAAPPIKTDAPKADDSLLTIKKDFESRSYTKEGNDQFVDLSLPFKTEKGPP